MFQVRPYKKKKKKLLTFWCLHKVVMSSFRPGAKYNIRKRKKLYCLVTAPPVVKVVMRQSKVLFRCHVL